MLVDTVRLTSNPGREWNLTSNPGRESEIHLGVQVFCKLALRFDGAELGYLLRPKNSTVPHGFDVPVMDKPENTL